MTIQTAPQIDNPTLEAALSYAESGWHVFPATIAKDGSKKSHVAGLKKGLARWGATTDPDTIKGYWAKWPDALVGIATGPSGLLVLDVDTKEGHDVDGLATMKDLIAKHGRLYPMAASRSPSGSRHFYYQQLDPPVSNGTNVLGPGVDVRGAGGMVIAPPSRVPGKGEYVWDKAPGAAPAPVPDWMIVPLSDKAPAPRQPGKYAGSQPPDSGTVEVDGQSYDVVDLRAYRKKPFHPEIREAVLSIGHASDKRPHGDSYEDWIKVGNALKWCQNRDPDADYFAVFDEWSALSDLKYEGVDNVRKHWDSFDPHSVTSHTIFDWAGQYGWKPSDEVATAKAGEAVQEQKQQLAGGKITNPLERAQAQALSIPGMVLHPNRKAPTVRDHPDNLTELLRHHPDWVGVIGFDEFTQKMILQAPVPQYDRNTGSRITSNAPFEPRELRDEDFGTIRAWFFRVIDPSAKFGDAERVVTEVAKTQWRFDSLRDMWDALPVWDGTKRLDKWLITYCNAKFDSPTHEKLVQAFGAKWLIGAAARCYRPGCQMDTVLVLCGEQGAKKTSTFRALAGLPEWHTDAIPADVSHKDARQHVEGIMIGEFGEIPQAKKEAEHLKVFITATVDKYRPPYGRLPVERKRRLVLAATTDEEKFTTDRAGNRRYWPVDVENIDVDGIVRDRDQLLAEAKQRFNAGETWWIDDQHMDRVAKYLANDRLIEEGWEPVAYDWLQTGEGSYMAEVYPGDIDEMLRRTSSSGSFPHKSVMTRRIGSWLQRQGWKRCARDNRGQRFRRIHGKPRKRKKEDEAPVEVPDDLLS